jgi:hypothetical protein
MMSLVVAGDYLGWQVSAGFKGMTLNRGFKKVKVDKETVESYELITDEHRKSAASGAVRGIVGGALLGPVGMLAGGLSAKEKGIYQVAIQFKDGKKSLLKLDHTLYDILIERMF